MKYVINKRFNNRHDVDAVTFTTNEHWVTFLNADGEPIFAMPSRIVQTIEVDSGKDK